MIDKHATLQYVSTPEAIPIARDEVRRALADVPLNPHGLQDLLVAVSEAVTNVIRHSGSPAFDVGISISENVVTIRIEDAGAGIDRQKPIEMPDPLQPGGRGLPLMSLLVDEFDLQQNEHGGTAIELRQRLSS